MRSWLILVLVALVICGALAPAMADTASRHDPDDSAGLLDVKRIRHKHKGQMLKHVIVTRQGWTVKGLEKNGGYIYFVFSWRGDNCLEGESWIDVHDGKLRASWAYYDPLCNDDNGSGQTFQDGLVEVIKPAKDRLVLLVSRDAFPKRADDYRWAVTTVWSCKNPCGDSAPDRNNSDKALFLHELKN